MRVLLAVAFAISTAAAQVTPPAQPAEGPGGSQYPHGKARKSHVYAGFTHYRLWEPAQPEPADAPVFVFFSGIASSAPYLGMIEFEIFAETYDAMFEHIARKGFTVVFPSYGPAGTPLHQHEKHALNGVRRALDRLSGPFHVDPRPGGIAVGGHSFGGLLSLKVADRAQDFGIPEVRAIVSQEPAIASQLVEVCEADPQSAFCPLAPPLAYPRIPASTVNVTIVGGEARLDALAPTVDQWELPQVPAVLESIWFIHDDERAGGSLIPTHLSNGAHPILELPGFELDAIDWFGYWKPTVAALSFAFFGTDREYVLGNGDAASWMGVWSDGIPVREMSRADEMIGLD